MTNAKPSLKTLLARQFMLLGALPVAAVFAAAWLVMAPLLVEQAETQHLELAMLVRQQIQLELQARERAGSVLASQLRDGHLSDDHVGEVMRSLLAADRFLQAVYVADERGRVGLAALAEGSGRYAADVIGLDLSRQPPFDVARRGQGPSWSDSFLSTLSGEITAVLAVPAGPRTVVMEISLATLSRSMADLARHGSSRVIVTDRRGRVVAHPDSDQAAQQQNLRDLEPIDSALSGRQATSRMPFAGEPHLAQALPVQPVGWVVLVVQPLRTVMAPVWRLAVVALAVLVVTLVLAGVVGMRLARRTGDEVSSLADAARLAAGPHGAPSPRDFSNLEFTAVWARLRELFDELTLRDRQTRAVQRELQAVLEAATQVAVVATDAQGVVTVFNIGAQRMLGWSDTDVVGRLTPLAWHDEGELAARARELGAVLGREIGAFETLVHEARHGGFEVRDWTFRRRDGSPFAVSLAVTAIRDADAQLKGFLGVAVDVTERRRADAAELARRSAEAASQAKSDFLSRMSHELRTPLNAILGYAQLLAMDPATPLQPRQREGVDHIQRAGWHLARLIDDVLDLSSIESGRLAVAIAAVDARAVAEQAQRLVAPRLAEAGVTLELRVEGDLAVDADETRLVQVLVNLLGNAAKYNRRGGQVRLVCRRLDGLVAFEVSDTGIGMTAEQVARLFEPFNRLGMDRSGIEGTGIGLVIARHLVGLMRGEIQVRSELGVGSTFVVLLPASAVACAAAGLAPTTAPAGAAALADPALRGSVLYIEDNEVNVEVMRAMLRFRPGLELRVADRAADGIAAARDRRPGLILLDMHLPDADGHGVIAELRADPRLRDVPVVVVSADATPAQIDAMYRLGVRAYLTKPLTIGEILRAVDAVFAAADEPADRGEQALDVEPH